MSLMGFCFILYSYCDCNNMIVYAFVIFSLTSVTVIAITQPCNETYVAENGHQCLPCDAGHHKVSDCIIDGTQSECSLCRNGTYMPSCDTAPKCITCRLDCPDKRQVQVKTCTDVSDIECQCEIGYFWKPSVIGPNHGECRPHQKCEEGHGVVAKGTPSSDTECVPCENGFTYSNSLSFESCVPCSSCNTFIETQCTAFNNTVCKEQQPKPQNEKSSDGLEPEAIVGIVIAVVAVIAVLIVILVIRRCRKDIEGEKPENAERGLGNDYSPSHVDTTNTGPGCSFSLSRDTTTNHNTNDEKATPASGERQNDPAKNGTDSFIINQAFDPDSEDKLEMEKSKGQDEVIFQLKT
ncbi:tumor necrosis factor receptor superfamily member 14-like isoform X1 [Ruditapes philippinarum]|uniref:tumor necrosis factor receptor superfamily member 14-like isoform X1 n=1 Tax=Ruditapes philippinarum TaxID=129788 RepID=UPI00295A8C10|nr:tumor necrosis factor receptor superfamily member 14-like isoform X1 [Ruditapes philippinarum]